MNKGEKRRTGAHNNAPLLSLTLACAYALTRPLSLADEVEGAYHLVATRYEAHLAPHISVGLRPAGDGIDAPGWEPGEVVRHRLSMAGNRHLNYALHMVALCQARSDVRGGRYYRKKIDEGKSRKEALRCLKRRISDAVYRSLLADSQAPSSSAA